MKKEEAPGFFADKNFQWVWFFQKVGHDMESKGNKTMIKGGGWGSDLNGT